MRPPRLLAPILAFWLFALSGARLLAAPVPSASAPSGPFGDWAAVVVSGDWRSHSGHDTSAFDNARRDVARALVGAGFDPAHVREFDLRPGPDGRAAASPADVAHAMVDGARAADGGCLFYVTSHGDPSGAVFGPTMTLTPLMLQRLMDEACGARPTVVVVSACFSGVFVPVLADRNRMIMSAARPDRSSFGCGDDDRYPYFDGCVLESFPAASDFIALARLTRACVARREAEERLSPPSEPQTAIGGQAQLLLPFLKFRSP